jgi:hypothetical protein
VKTLGSSGQIGVNANQNALILKLKKEQDYVHQPTLLIAMNQMKSQM